MTLEEATFYDIIVELAKRFDVGIIAVLQKTGHPKPLPPYTHKVRLWGDGIPMIGLANYICFEANQIVRAGETPDPDA